MSSKKVRVRIAPSPTGYPHIGTIYQALFNYAFAKKHDGEFIVRIEDTDRKRLVEDAEKKIYEALDWFGLTEDESPRKGGDFGPYKQSERLEIYHKYAQELLDKGKAVMSFAPKDEDKNETNPPKTIKDMLKQDDWVLRIKLPDRDIVNVKDEIRGEIKFNVDQITPQVLLKSDGYPTYHLAVVVDDHKMGITDAVRGEEWITSFPVHHLLYEYFNWEMPRFYHTPVLRNPDKSKLSKRQGHTNVSWYQENGYLKIALLNFLSLLGWSHPEQKEIFTLDEFIEKMDLKDIKPVGPIFNLEKLDWMNGEYIRLISTEDLIKKLIEFNPAYDKIDKNTLTQFADLAKTRMKTLKDFDTMVMPFLKPNKNEDPSNILPTLGENLESLDDWEKDKLHSTIIKSLNDTNSRFPDLYMTLTGNKFGLPMADVFTILGKQKTLELLS